MPKGDALVHAVQLLAALAITLGAGLAFLVSTEVLLVYTAGSVVVVAICAWLVHRVRQLELNAETQRQQQQQPIETTRPQQVMKTVVQPPQWQRRQGVDWLKLPTLGGSYVSEADGVGGQRLVSR